MKINKVIWFFITQTIYKLTFRKIGKKTIIIKPVQIDDASSISIGKNVRICEGSWLMGSKNSNETLCIEDSVCIGHYSHIIAKHSIVIKQNVLIADKVFITDCTHKYEDSDRPIISQGIELLSDVVIGEDSWIGENVSILGVSIGKHCIVGSNSVVTKSLPDYCVAAGVPAKIIKKYNHSNNIWENVE